MTAAPTLETYLAWARGQGCTVDLREDTRTAQPLCIVAIRAPSGRTALEIALEPGDPLMSTTIARLDRRLGLKSSLFV